MVIEVQTGIAKGLDIDPQFVKIEVFPGSVVIKVRIGFLDD